MLLDKTQLQVESEYYWVDLPELLRRRNEAKAAELLMDLNITVFPHLTDKGERKRIMSSITNRLPKPPEEPIQTADDQYEALKRKMNMGKG